MKTYFALLLACLWLPAAFAVDPPATANAETELPPIDLEAPTLYKAIEFEESNPNRLELLHRFDDIEPTVARSRELRQAFRDIKHILTKDTRELYDWFLDKIRQVPEHHQGIAREHLQLFREYLGEHLPKVKEKHARLTIFDHRRELVRFLGNGGRDKYPYRIKEMLDDVMKTPAAEEVKREFERTFSFKWPVRIAACVFLLVGTVFSYNLWQRAMHSEATPRIQQHAPEVPLRHTVPHQAQPELLPEDPLFQEGVELGRDLPPAVPPKAPVEPAPKQLP